VRAVGGPGNIEVEREVLADRENVAQIPLLRIVHVDALRAVAGPQRLDRIPRLPDRES
jgi:hypothetical protein